MRIVPFSRHDWETLNWSLAIPLYLPHLIWYSNGAAFVSYCKRTRFLNESRIIIRGIQPTLHRILFAVAWTVDLHAPWPDLERRLNPLNTKTINRHPLTTPHLRGIRRLKKKKKNSNSSVCRSNDAYLSSFAINIFCRSMSPDSISRFTLLPRSPRKHSVLFRASQWKYK